jgi:hypothetical protein
MHPRTLALAATVGFLLVSCTASAQFRAHSVNPEAIEFEAEMLLDPVATGYRVEFFRAGYDTQRDDPVKMLNLPRGIVQEGGRVRVVIRDFVLDMPNGQYVATIRTIAGPRQSARSAPTDVFVLALDGSPSQRVADDRRERFWTKVGIALGASVFLIPVVIR